MKNKISILNDVAVTYTLKAKRQRKSYKNITDSNLLSQYARDLFSSSLLVHEQFYAIFLNQQNQIVGNAMISSGGINNCLIDKRLIFKYAIETLASSIILCHNHPSGTLNPSETDITLTQTIAKGCNLLNLKLLDHLIFTEDSYYSFADSKSTALSLS